MEDKLERSLVEQVKRPSSLAHSNGGEDVINLDELAKSGVILDQRLALHALLQERIILYMDDDCPSKKRQRIARIPSDANFSGELASSPPTYGSKKDTETFMGSGFGQSSIRRPNTDTK
ncbi:predicted protein [Botrytis cinerea T4]|uniref:Uncharacterized protein n=1 Tax=Botryotinia fuckeliana (strain T4) TaxID=999810 RepID=G2YF63_BOTF4|nr:predicted protein [Botrytis cinerea T4]